MDTLAALFNGDRLRYFTELQTRYTKFRALTLKFAQVKQLIADLPHRQCAIPTTLLHLLRSSPNPLAKGTKLFYNLLTSNDLFSKIHYMIKSEADFRKTFSELQWSKVIHYAHHS